MKLECWCSIPFRGRDQSLRRLQTGSEAHPEPVGIEVSSSRVKESGRDVTQLVSPSTEVINAWSYISTIHTSS
jgi:hypothetical protein